MKLQPHAIIAPAPVAVPAVDAVVWMPPVGLAMPAVDRLRTVPIPCRSTTLRPSGVTGLPHLRPHFLPFPLVRQFLIVNKLDAMKECVGERNG